MLLRAAALSLLTACAAAAAAHASPRVGAAAPLASSERARRQPLAALERTIVRRRGPTAVKVVKWDDGHVKWDDGHVSGRWPRELPPESNCSSGDSSLQGAFETVGHLTGVQLLPTLAVLAAGAAPPPPSLGDETSRLGRISDDAEIVINLGQGTTGTHGVFMTLNRIGAGSHFSSHSNGTGTLHERHGAAQRDGARDIEQLARYTFQTVNKCAQLNETNFVEADCRASTLAPRLARDMMHVLQSGVQHIHDSPWPMFATDAVAMSGQSVRFMLSYRDAEAWAWQRGAGGHGRTPVCTPEAAAHAHSWFNLGECLRYTGSGVTAWERIKTSLARDTALHGQDAAFEILAAKYAFHNAYITQAVVAPERMRKVCVWDGEQSGLVGMRFASTGRVVSEMARDIQAHRPPQRPEKRLLARSSLVAAP